MSDENKYIQTPSQSIQKSYLRQPVSSTELEKFRSQLDNLLKELNPTDIEEANKGRVKTFLEQTLWPSNAYEINASGKTDLTIKDKNLERNVVLFEFKKVNSPEMVTKDMQYVSCFLTSDETLTFWDIQPCIIVILRVLGLSSHDVLGHLIYQCVKVFPRHYNQLVA